MAMKNRKRGSEDFFSSGFTEQAQEMSSPRKRPMTEGYQTVPQKPKYPETMSAFADGIKSDFFDIFSTGATALGSTVRLFFPMHSVDETTEDSLKDIEVSTPMKVIKSRSSLASPSPSPLKQKIKDSQTAVRMRCSNLWSEADRAADLPSSISSSSSSSISMPDLFSSPALQSLDEATHGRGDISSASASESRSASSQATKKNNAKAQKGGKVLLTKLMKNPTIQYFPCGQNDDKLIILGNLRMIHCVKNNDVQNTATIIWSEKFQEIASCVISCSVGESSNTKAGKLESKLDITTRDDKMFSVVLDDAVLCIQVMQIIQQRCLPPSASNATATATTANVGTGVSSAAGSEGTQTLSLPPNQSVDLLGLESFSVDKEDSSRGDMAPLSIGSSPKRTSTRRMVNKRPPKTKLMINIKRDSSSNQFENTKENTSINRLPPPPSSSGGGGAAAAAVCCEHGKKRQEVDLINFDDVEEGSSSGFSPSKKMKISNSISVVTCAAPQQEQMKIANELPASSTAAVTPHTVAPPVLLSPPAPASAQALPAHLKKYSVMLKSGVPLQAVQQKMTLEGVSAQDISSVCASSSGSVSGGVADTTSSVSKASAGSTSVPVDSTSDETTSASSSIPTHLKKYQVMIKSGVPQNAVKQKMSLEGVSQDHINLVLGIKNSEISLALKKFQVMLKSGIPPGAVEHKMTMEGVSASDQALVLGNKASSTSRAVRQSSALKTPSSSSSGPQLLGLHWDPIAETNDSLAKSMWGDIHSPTSPSPSSSSDTEKKATTKRHHQLQEKEFDSLSSMFSRKATPAKSGTKPAATTADVASSDRSLRSKSKMPTTIDMSRSTNISIGMSSFKQKKLTTASIVQAINHMDTSVLNHEDLSRLYEILPSDSEKKTFSGKLSTARIEGFHDTEKWLHQLSTIENCKEKVDAMLFMTSYSQNSEATSKALNALVSFSELVVSSAALKEVMKCILAIGNSLNQGTYKGAAKGFRLGSLLKLHQTKSTDGKSTVMDYLIQILHSRYVTGDLKAGSALSLNDELCDVNQVKNINVTETSRDVSDMKKHFEKLKVLFQKVIEAKDNSNMLIDTDFENASNETNITQFIAATEVSLTSLEALKSLLLSRCSSVILFFGEEEGSSVQHMYTMLAEFIAGYAQSKRKFEDNLRKESRLKAAAAKKAAAAVAGATAKN